MCISKFFFVTQCNLDIIIVVRETKIDASVSEASISIPGFEHKPFRLDRNLRGGGIVTYVRVLLSR